MKSKTKAYIGLTLLFLVMSYGAFVLFKKEKLLKEYGRITFATIENIEVGSKGIRIYLSYNYENKKLKGDYIAEYQDRSKLFVGKRVFIKFIPPEYDFEYMEIYLDCIVPDSIKKAPPLGWSKEWMEQHFPECVDL